MSTFEDGFVILFDIDKTLKQDVLLAGHEESCNQITTVDMGFKKEDAVTEGNNLSA